jgi:hypothetical protein
LPNLPIAYFVGSCPQLSTLSGNGFFEGIIREFIPEETVFPMLNSMERLQNLENLREYVNKILCQHDQFEFGAFRMTERILVRGNRPCGIFFCLHGPRSVKVTAIWETDRNTILFYSSTGERFHRTRLASAPALIAATS